MNPIDQNLVNEFLTAWNIDRESTQPLWIEAKGTYALMQMDLNEGNPPMFQNNSGFPLKVFKNTETQELRIFDARRFSKL